MRDYHPIQTQKDFHASTARFRGIRGEYGSGKTTALVYESIALSLGTRASTGIITAPNEGHLKGGVQRLMMLILNEEKIKHIFSPSTGTLTFSATGNQIVFLPFSVDRIAGITANWFAVDDLDLMELLTWDTLTWKTDCYQGRGMASFAAYEPQTECESSWPTRTFLRRGYKVFGSVSDDGQSKARRQAHQPLNA